MHRKFALFAFAALAAVLLPVRTVHADDLNGVLQKLDAAAKGFETTSANVEFDTIQTDPVPDKDVMTGIAFYERSGKSFRMAAHITKHNGRPGPRTYIFSGGVLRISDTGKGSDAKTYNQVSKYESYLMLGFGASGHDLADKWTIKYLGSETINGVKTDKLELIAKDPQVRKTVPRVTLWLDTAHAVSLKQAFDEGEGQSRICYYSNIKVNQPLPKTAFSFDSGK